MGRLFRYPGLSNQDDSKPNESTPASVERAMAIWKKTRSSSKHEDVPKEPGYDYMNIPYTSPLEPYRKKLLRAQSLVETACPTPIEAQSVPNDVLRDRDWLLQHCKFHLSAFPNISMNAERLCIDIFTILRSGQSDEGIQASLADLIGYDNFEFLSVLVAKRKEILETIMTNALIEINETEELDIQDSNRDLFQDRQQPQYGAQFTVITAAEKAMQKASRKEKRKLKSNPQLLAEEKLASMSSAEILKFEGERLRQARIENLISGGKSASTTEQQEFFEKEARNAPSYPHIYSSGTGGSVLTSFGTRFQLPLGTTREDNQDMEEITIPVSRPAAVRTTERMISISELNEVGRVVFRAYESLNRVQSIVFPVAYKSNANMLVCAPTGAGKTDVAMLTVSQVLESHYENGYLRTDDFKIVYVAPMKALAAEVVRKFSKRLAPLKVAVRELTGDMQLTKAEMRETQILVTTPEKWDVVTRKSVGDSELTLKVKLLIIDEVHLLHEERGAVIESIVARTLRLVESSQSMIRIVGLSATLPNYVDVATFLGVNPYEGLFYFDSGFRPVPLEQHFVGIKGKAGSLVMRSKMDTVCFDKVVELAKEGHQVMIFVHSRKEAVKTGRVLMEYARNSGQLDLFDCSNEPNYDLTKREVHKSRNKELKELFPFGFGFHHAGMLRSDRTLVESLFEKGLLKVLCCTATLAWGVNLPAYAVIIKGTDIYDPQKGTFVDLSILDVFQIFGRAGRPQYEDCGVGYILTPHEKLNHYVSLVTQQHAIESMFGEKLVDNLNAEISLGTVTNVDEGVRWLSYSYYMVRMKRNPFHYGIDWKTLQNDPSLAGRRRELIIDAAKVLHRTNMIVFDERTGFFTCKDVGRIASNFYISQATIDIFNANLHPRMTEADVLSVVALSSEFEHLKVRDEEHSELKKLLDNETVCAIKGGIDSSEGKSNILLQAYVSQSRIEDFALISDMGYVAQNSARILRALFEIAMSRNWGPTASVILSLCKTVDRRLWSFESPLKQFNLPHEVLVKLDKFTSSIPIEELRDMPSKDLGALIRHNKMGDTVSRCAWQFPVLEIDAKVWPITRSVLRIILHVVPNFNWNDSMHGTSEPFWIWVEDPESVEILYSQYILITKKKRGEVQTLTFTIPIPKNSKNIDELPSQIFVRATSDRWIGSETYVPISFKHLILPQHDGAQHTSLLSLAPLPISALQNDVLESICKPRFEFFNPVQTQIFHTLYHTSHNVLLGAPTGSGKTMAAELAMWSAFRDHPQSKVVYIAPLKALVKERISDWTRRLTSPMNRRLVELTGDVTPDLKTIEGADIIITTPEKWDGISRGWKSRKYVTQVSLVIIDEIHLLGGDRGPILEVIVSRLNHISAFSGHQIRIVGLSTALANANDLADWLGIKKIGLFNFRHSVRPVPLQIFIEGYPGKHYCPRMMSMNKPTYSAILTHSPKQPVIVFVSSRRQTRLTAQDLMSLCAMDDQPRRFLRMDEQEANIYAERVRDAALKLCIQFGIGLHHAGLLEADRQIVEELFVKEKIQILVATSTLAWGVNFPAHLVVVKGTEFYDAKEKGYVDYPITDVLQMMGRAGRPQFDDSGVAVVMVHDIKKSFYKKFLHEPFPVESSLHKCLHDHINAEIAGETIKTKQDALEYLSWTYMYRRIQMNPMYYGAADTTEFAINERLSQIVEETLQALSRASCIEIDESNAVSITPFGKITSTYYLRYTTIHQFKSRLVSEYAFSGNINDNQFAEGDFPFLLRILCDASEYDELPVRHNEDLMNRELEKLVKVKVADRRGNSTPFGQFNTIFRAYDDPHVKAFLLLQAHLGRVQALPSADYHTDKNTVLDQAIRVTQAMIDVATQQRFLNTSLGLIQMLQCVKQALWPTDSPLYSLPHFSRREKVNLVIPGDDGQSLTTLDDLLHYYDTCTGQDQADKLLSDFSNQEKEDIKFALDSLPRLTFDVKIDGVEPKSNGKWILQGSSTYKLSIGGKCTRGRRFSQKSYGRGRKDSSNPTNSGEFKLYAPLFPKQQTEGWFLVVSLDNTLVGLKRLSGDSMSTNGSFSTIMNFEAPGPGMHRLSLQMISDGYIGLETSMKMDLDVTY